MRQRNRGRPSTVGFPHDLVANLPRSVYQCRTSRPVQQFLMKKTFFSTLAAAIGLAVPLVSAQDIVVGEIVSLTGDKAGFGNELHNATVMAVEETNAAGGLLGKKIKLVSEDTQSKPGEPAAAVQK